jgi:NAD(P)-dependent dehydrogenase (short-subunit alcohol dehydrogenase family)
MARIFITGSADGLGQLAGSELVKQGHQVVLHARNEQRAREALKKSPGAETVLTADLASMQETKDLAAQVNSFGKFDAVIHNAGVYQVDASEIFAVNTIAPYILTCLIERPNRLIYLSSGMHTGGYFNEEHFKPGSSRFNYSDSKLHVMMLSMAVARKWPEVYSNAVDPGWVPTKMGGRGAPDDLQKGYSTQVWLAVSNDAEARVSGRYFHHKKQSPFLPVAKDIVLQEKLLECCERITGLRFL